MIWRTITIYILMKIKDMSVGDVIGTSLFLGLLKESREQFRGTEAKYGMNVFADEDFRTEYLKVLEKRSELNANQRNYVNFVGARAYRMAVESIIERENNSLQARVRRLFGKIKSAIKKWLRLKQSE